MVEEDLIDLPARTGKGTGAFCSGFPFEKVPFIFCNSVGAHDDVKTLIHEYGHALQGWRSRDIEPIDMQHPTMEACEIHSMTLELLAMPYLEPFFGESGLEHFRVEHLRSTLDVVPLFETLDDAGELRLLTDGKALFLRTQQGHVFDLLVDPMQPMIADGLPLKPVTARAQKRHKAQGKRQK